MENVDFVNIIKALGTPQQKDAECVHIVSQAEVRNEDGSPKLNSDGSRVYEPDGTPDKFQFRAKAYCSLTQKELGNFPPTPMKTLEELEAIKADAESYVAGLDTAIKMAKAAQKKK